MFVISHFVSALLVKESPFPTDDVLTQVAGESGAVQTVSSLLVLGVAQLGSDLFSFSYRIAYNI